MQQQWPDIGYTGKAPHLPKLLGDILALQHLSIGAHQFLDGADQANWPRITERELTPRDFPVPQSRATKNYRDKRREADKWGRSIVAASRILMCHRPIDPFPEL